MAEDWLNKIRESQADFTEPEPEGLWDGIAAGLSEAAAGGHPAVGKPSVVAAGTASGDSDVSRGKSSRWWWAAAALPAAAVAALVLFLTVPGRETASGNPSSEPLLAVVEQSQDRPEPSTNGASGDADADIADIADIDIADSDVSDTYAAKYANGMGTSGRNSFSEPASEQLLAYSEPSPVREDTPDEVAGGSLKETSESEGTSDVIPPTEKPAERTERMQARTDGGSWTAEDERPSRKVHRGGFKVGLLASNVAGSRSSSSEYAALYGSTVVRQIHGFSETSADFPDCQGYAGVLKSNVSNEVSSTVKNWQPVQVGVSVAYSITDRLSIESGLTYSCLISDLSSGTSSGNYGIRQTLHYVGIPLNLRYDFLKFSKFSLYASAGGQMEKCVAGKTRTDYFVDGKKISSEDGHIMVEPLQWSVNAYIGAQYSFSRLVGLYVEPGAAYYFSNGSPVNCIYSERPFNFSIRAGLRFSL